MSMPGVHGHTGHSQTPPLSKLQQLTFSQGIMQDLQSQSAAVQQSHHVAHTPPPQKPAKSSKNRTGGSTGTTAASVGAPPSSHLLPGYPAHMAAAAHNYPGQQVAARVGSSASQARPNVNLPAALSMHQYAMMNPMLYPQHYNTADYNRQMSSYPGYG